MSDLYLDGLVPNEDWRGSRSFILFYYWKFSKTNLDPYDWFSLDSRDPVAVKKRKKKQSLVIQSVLCYEEILDMFIFDPP